MEEQFKVGDPVVVNTPYGDRGYGTIISISDKFANIDTCQKRIPVTALHHATDCFRVGSIVQIKKNLRHGVLYGSLKFYNSDLCGLISTVTKISKNGTYYLEDVKGQTFSKEMLEFPINKGDTVTIKPSAYSKHPNLVGYLYKITEMTEDGRILNLDNRYGVSVLDVEKIFSRAKVEDTLTSIGDDKIEFKHGDCKEIFNLNELSDENQLQRKDSSVIRGDRPEGSRIYGRRPKATISVRPLSHKTCTGFSQGQG